MAIDVIRDNIPNLQPPSPRISFSIDLHHHQKDHDSDYSYRSDSSSDFDFCFSSNNSATSSADELFSDGLIRPLQLQEKFVISKSFSVSGRPQKHQASLPPLPPPRVYETSSKVQIVSSNLEAETKHQSKSFWGIKRCSSLHCDSSRKKSSFWSLPLLSRSNSVPKASSKEGQKQNSNSKNSKKLTSSSSSSCSSACANSTYPSGYASFYSHPLPRKSPSRMKNGGSTTHTNGVRINPVINVPPPSFNFKGTANLFGFGYLFRNGRDKKNKK